MRVNVWEVNSATYTFSGVYWRKTRVCCIANIILRHCCNTFDFIGSRRIPNVADFHFQCYLQVRCLATRTHCSHNARAWMFCFFFFFLSNSAMLLCANSIYVILTKSLFSRYFVFLSLSSQHIFALFSILPISAFSFICFAFHGLLAVVFLPFFFLLG